MQTPAEQYEQLVGEEDRVVFGIQTCEHCVKLLLDNLKHPGEAQKQDPNPEILKNIHEVEQLLRGEWLNIKIQKELLANQMKHNGDV
ncbi:hypothetical protein HT747_07875 [Brevibacillus borstelensis]|uniref:hypothetical protein n=1 Tax=Brevibacillus borstelensis TaxID=45462 RepID=UPI0015626965|nr:hypothetical protein [Brevibacillus borstelensis]MBE5395063.1 hypothetical protein [Brevibacillus borstelensis]